LKIEKCKVKTVLLKKFLLDPAIYPDHPKEVRVKETHISLVFLTGRYAYKVKKAVDFGFLDFTSLERRKYYCRREVTLNRRLSSGIYLGVVAIAFDGESVSLNGRGRVIEYAVRMKQVPEERFLDRLLKKNRVTPVMMDRIAEKLAQFHRKAQSGDPIRRFARPERIKHDTDENFEQTRRYVGVTISGKAYSDIKTRTDEFFRTRERLFHRRMESGAIRDCHGDLRLEHIVWGEEIAILDCIEFNERFRYTDVAADLGFLAMDLDYEGREDLSKRLVRTYMLKSGDRDLRGVLDFYQCYRAYVRGKVESFRLDAAETPEKEKREAIRRARRYFNLSYRYAQRFQDHRR
jgi:aminoglycoside phosphotransferase family enzyme